MHEVRTSHVPDAWERGTSTSLFLREGRLKRRNVYSRRQSFDSVGMGLMITNLCAKED